MPWTKKERTEIIPMAQRLYHQMCSHGFIMGGGEDSAYVFVIHGNNEQDVL